MYEHHGDFARVSVNIPLQCQKAMKIPNNWRIIRRSYTWIAWANWHGRGSQVPTRNLYLFAAFAIPFRFKVKSLHIPSTKWISFWYQGRTHYTKPSNRRAHKVRLKETHNTSGDLLVTNKQNREEEAVFCELGIKLHLWPEISFATFLACWLYIFIFLQIPLRIVCPSTFKVASLLAKDSLFVLQFWCWHKFIEDWIS